MRAALLGSLGRGTKWNLPRHMLTQLATSPANLLGAAGTFAAVPAGNHLDLTVTGIPGTVVIPFLGTEATLAAYIARINAVRATLFQRGGFNATSQGGQLSLLSFYLGSMGRIVVAATTSAAVLAALGVASGQVSIVSSGIGLGTQRQRISAIQFFGGTLPGAGLRRNQHATVLRRGGQAGLIMVDRNQLTTIGADSTRFAPTHQAT